MIYSIFNGLGRDISNSLNEFEMFSLVDSVSLNDFDVANAVRLNDP